ncbi:hypothetical protein FHW20_001850 [Ochrobactrum intermedium]|uniref:Uncharacterized protein n=1 Tax=Brucella intermedia TaxID=94625 RepID=A0ABR6AN76_9HYPH|nr:hypothetical protein [Brucella intermedia]MBA8850915.1 hypothetical protein [Brucella intermedia]NYD84283.1 hypothetical protein [Brucella intermedia]
MAEFDTGARRSAPHKKILGNRTKLEILNDFKNGMTKMYEGCSTRKRRQGVKIEMKILFWVIGVAGLLSATNLGLAQDLTRLCQTVEMQYRNLPRNGKVSNKTPDVLAQLVATASTGITEATTTVEDVTPEKLVEWAKAGTPPVSLPSELIEQITGNTDTIQDMNHLPGTNFYVVNGTAGSLSCYQPGVYFRIENGQVVNATGPDNWLEEGSGCQVIRSFGTIDSVPAAFEKGYNGEDSDYVLNISPWTGTGFGPACTATFQFENGRLSHVTVK